jgi:ATP-binding cassette, subfamily B (MDR/TAP), member 1
MSGAAADPEEIRARVVVLGAHHAADEWARPELEAFHLPSPSQSGFLAQHGEAAEQSTTPPAAAAATTAPPPPPPPPPLEIEQPSNARFLQKTKKACRSRSVSVKATM